MERNLESNKKSGVSGRSQQGHCRFIRRSELQVPGSERGLPIVVEDLGTDLQEKVSATGRPLNLLFLDHPFAQHLVDCRLDKAHGDTLAAAIPFSIIDEIGATLVFWEFCTLSSAA